MYRICNGVLAAAVLTVITGGCGPETMAGDVCDEAARHIEECTGDYQTPPICDDAAAAAAADLVDMSCDDLEQRERLGKADGAFCDWFGWGCTPDEAIFTGPSCDSDRDCSGGAYCVESHCFAGVDSAEMDGILDGLTGWSATGGNYTHLLVDNSESRELRRAMIESAEQSIHFTALLIEDDEQGYEFASMLKAAVARGVEVRVVVDATTSYFFGDYAMLEDLAAAGVEVLPYNPVTEWAWLRFRIDLSANKRLHEKLLIVDGAEAIVSGRNVGDDYLLPEHWRDTGVYVTGPAVREVQALFLGIWDQFSAWEALAGCPQRDSRGFYCPADGQPLAADARYYPELDSVGTARVRPVYSDPRSQTTPHGYATTIALVRAARHSIEITNSYFVPPRRLRKHLKAAAARGVKVVVITNSKGSTDATHMYYASLNYYEELIRAGVEIRQYRGTETMHAKTMLIDDELALVGSYNLDPRSATSNSEASVIIDRGAAVDELDAAFEIDKAYTDVADYDIPIGEMLKARAFRLVEPLL